MTCSPVGYVLYGYIGLCVGGSEVGSNLVKFGEVGSFAVYPMFVAKNDSACKTMAVA